MKNNIKVVNNQAKNGIELYFDSKPEQSTINSLKGFRFRWHNSKKCWYAKVTDEIVSYVEDLTSGTPIQIKKDTKSKKITYSKNMSDYIDVVEYEKQLIKFYSTKQERRYLSYNNTEEEIERSIADHVSRFDKYPLTYIREAIIWKSLGKKVEDFYSNGDRHKYYAIWDFLPIVEGLKPNGKEYSAMWGYDQTQITTAVCYGKAWGLDVLVTGSYGRSEVLLKRINEEGCFSESCMHFSPNSYSDKYVQETNEYAMIYGR